MAEFIEHTKQHQEYETDEVKRYVARREMPLAELRAKNAWEISEIKCVLNESEVSKGCCIGISPRDDVLQKLTRGEITMVIKNIFKRMRIRSLLRPKGVTTADAPSPPITLILALVGEYSPEHRWHYHGLILVPNIVILTKIKRKIQQIIGRTVTENCKNVPKYIDYMFKTYDCENHSDFYDWDRKDCYLEVLRRLDN